MDCRLSIINHFLQYTMINTCHKYKNLVFHEKCICYMMMMYAESYCIAVYISQILLNFDEKEICKTQIQLVA